MNNLDKQYTDLIDEVYKNYRNSKECQWTSTYFPTPLTKKEFINKIKTVDEFAKKWGVKVEIRELSLEERVRLTINTAEYRNYTEEQWKEYIDTASVPKRVISLTYNNETIESYE